ncbi:MAG TPA: hypothetical protein VN441_10820 [Syntrophomonas sp.]|nr:hypothetical protein [Syntrophomonas sp.]
MKNFMKKAAVMFSVLVLALSLTGCGTDTEEPVATTATATLIADFGDGLEGENRTEYAWEYEEPLDIAVLSAGLSATTGLDFFVNSEIAGDKAFIAWLDTSTLVSGIDDREWNEGFVFYDAVSLNWFMMDSLAATVKANFPAVTEVYYSGENGAPVVFPNPEDMATQGLPTLPTDQPYEGSAFFKAHAEAKGDMSDDSPDNDQDTLWAGTFTSNDGQKTLSFEDYNGQSFRFAFVSSDNSGNGSAKVSADNVELAESDGLTFWFMDKDTLLVSGGAFEGTYIRNGEDLS